MLNVEHYIDRIMKIADLTGKDDKRVRTELSSHIQELLNAGEKSGLKESEVMSMIEKEFGKPEELGKMIAKARGRFRTYLKKKARKVPIQIGMVLVIAIVVQIVAFQAFRVPTDAASPIVPKNSRVLVNKLTNNFNVDDVIIFRPEKQAMIGIVKEIDKIKNGVIATRKGSEDIFVPKDRIVGKALLIYFCTL